MQPQDIIAKLENILKSAPEVTEAFYATKAVYENIKQQEKPNLAVIAQSFEGSEAARERQALASDEHTLYLQGLEEARRKHYAAMAKFKRLELALAVCQSMNKIMTAQINISSYE